MPVIRLAALWIVMLGTGTALAAPAKPPTSKPIVFAFDWPAGQSPRVTTETSREDSRVPRRATSGSYTLLLTKDGSAWRARAAEISTLVPNEPGQEAQPKSPSPEMAAFAGAEFRVDAEGHFNGLVDPAAAQQAARAVSGKVVDGSKANGAQILAAVTDPKLLEVFASDLWEPIVGSWAGVSLDADAEYEFDAEQSLPAFGIDAFPLKSRVVVRPAPPCMRGGESHPCVWVEVTQTAEPAAFAKALRESVRRLGGKDVPENAFDDATMVVKTRLLTEPTGLIPHEYAMEKTVRIGAAGGADDRSLIQSDRRTFDFVATSSTQR